MASPDGDLKLPIEENAAVQDANSSSADVLIVSPVWRPDVWKPDDIADSEYIPVSELGSMPRLVSEYKKPVSVGTAAPVQQGIAGGMEASSLGAAGKLSGAKDSTWQDQC
jgi:hypothetical protein